MFNLSGLRRFLSAISPFPPMVERGDVGPDFFDTFNSTAANIHVQVSSVGHKFTVTVICEACQKAQPAKGFIFNAADENLAIAVGFSLAEFGKHCARAHRETQS